MESIKSIYNLLSYIAEMDRLDSKDILNIIPFHINVMEHVRKKYMNSDESISSESNESWFDLLPCIIQTKIFKLLDHYSLIQFSHAYSCYKSTIFHPKYWTNCGVRLDDLILTKDEFELLSNYLNEYLLEADIDFYDVEEDKIFDIMTHIAKTNSKLRKLKIDCNLCPKIIELVNTSFAKLNSLDINCLSLNDNHVVQITDNLIHLISLKITSHLEISFGLEYFLEHVKYLEGFGFLVKKTSKRVFDLVHEKHKNTLKYLSYGMDRLDIDDEILTKLKDFNQLCHLELFNYRLSRPIYQIIDEFINLESLKLACNYVKNMDYAEILFTRFQPKLKRLGLQNFNISKNGLDLLGVCCPNLEMLSIDNVLFSDDWFCHATKYLKRLKYLFIKEKSQYQGDLFTFKMIDETISNLKQLEFLYIDKNTNRNVLKFMSKIANLYKQDEFKVATIVDSERVFYKNFL